MIALFYLILSFFIGYNIIKKFFDTLFKLHRIRSFTGKAVRLRHWMVTIPASYLTGTLLITWITYLLVYAFHKTGKPMLYGNIASLAIFNLISALIIINNLESCLKYIKKIINLRLSDAVYFLRERLPAFIRGNLPEVVFTGIVTVIASFMMIYTFNVSGDIVNIGRGVWGDFGPHIAVIRSFSLGSNIPTEYPHFAMGKVLTGANNIRYHFLFQFLTGNLEYLGFRIDWAFNIPSILSMVFFLMLLYSLAVILTGSRFVGFLSMVFFYFRSSFAFFPYALERPSLTTLISDIANNTVYLGKTNREWWGIWTQNVYVNQRHFAFSLAVLVLVIIILLPLLRKMVYSLNRIRYIKAGTSGSRLRLWINEFLIRKDSWTPQSLSRALVLGILIGSISFWNGAVAFSLISILFVMALLSKHRLEYLVTALVVLVLFFMESTFFVGDAAKTVSPRMNIGFLADIPAEVISPVNEAIRSNRYLPLVKQLPALFFYVGKYYVEVLGIMPFLVLISLFFSRKGMRWLALSFLGPLVIATTVALTPEIAVNHKFVNISVILLNIFAAYVIYLSFTRWRIAGKIVSVSLIFLMTITGAVDNIAVINSNNPSTYMSIHKKDPVTVWVLENAGPNEVFLTDDHIFHPILFAGRKIFFGSPAFAYSAGYDIFERQKIVNEIYGGKDPERVKRLVEENNIGYIVIEQGNRESKKYRLNEDLIAQTFQLKYENPAYNIKIYSTGIN